MKFENRRQIEPLCKFGPGGDFAFGWSPSRSGLGKLLEVIAGKVNKEYADKANRRVDSAAGGTAESDSGFQGEPMLFADDCRIGTRIKSKPKHGVRASRRTSKKRVSGNVHGQGSLFETDFEVARTA